MPLHFLSVLGLRHAGLVLGCLAAAVVLACAPAAGSPRGPAALGGAPSSAPIAAAWAPVPGAPPGVMAFVDVTVIPMDRERVLAHQTVLVREGWIAALGPADRVPVPTAARRIDGRGKFLLPGLSECHGHLSVANLARRTDYDTVTAAHRLFLYLANGVTTLRNLDYIEFPGQGLRGGEWLRLRERAAAGELWSPRIYTSGQWAPDLNAVKPESVAIYVAAYKAAGYDFLKVHEESVEIIDSVAAAARRIGLPVVGHVRGSVEHDLVLGAYRSFEHLDGYIDTAVVEGRKPSTPAVVRRIAELAGATARAGVWNCPTLVNVNDALATMTASTAPAYMYEDQGAAVHLHRQTVKALHDSGAGLLLGTDVPVPYRADQFDRTIPSDENRLLTLGDPGAIHEELVELVRAGLTPYQALAAGTRNMAAYLGTLDSSGTVAVGRRADLLLLSGNPLEDVHHTARPAGVMIGGRWLPRAELDRRLAAIEALYTAP